jgi:hypothetical protein
VTGVTDRPVRDWHIEDSKLTHSVAHERPDGLQEPAEVVTATLKNGILNLELPKAAKYEPAESNR